MKFSIKFRRLYERLITSANDSPLSTSYEKEEIPWDIYDPLLEVRSPKLRKIIEKKNPAAGWSKKAPMTKSEREKKKESCGSKCFLDPKNLRFPVCPKNSCEPDCGGVLAAFRRARQYHHNDIARKAFRLAKRLKCSWAEDKTLKDYGL